MATVNEIANSFNVPNYHGRVHQLTPDDTPFYNLCAGASEGGGEVVNHRTFEWQTFDLRAAAQNTKQDSAPAPDEESRDRSNVFNVLQTHIEAVGVGYEKLAQTEQFDGRNIGQGPNPVQDEGVWQINQMWKQIKRDMEFSLIQGTYNLPSSASDAGQTRGIIEAITTNTRNATGDFDDTTPDNTADNFTQPSSIDDFSNGEVVEFSSDTSPTGIEDGKAYFVVNATDTDFQVSESRGGSVVTFSDNGSNVTVARRKSLNEFLLEDVMQDAYDQGGLQEGEMRTLLVPSVHKRQITDELRQKGVEPRNRSIMGVNVGTIETSFGDLNVVVDRHVPDGTALVVSVDQCGLCHRLVPEKGVTFAEPLAKDGARNRTQLYTSVGLKYGNEEAHGKITNLSIARPTA